MEPFDGRSADVPGPPGRVLRNLTVRLRPAYLDGLWEP